MNPLRRAIVLSAAVGSLLVGASAPASASCVELSELLAASAGDAWAFVGTAEGRDGDLVTLDVSQQLLGSPGDRVTVSQAEVPPGDRMQVGGEYVVVLVDPDAGAVQRPANECTIAVAETGTSEGQALRSTVNDAVLPPTDAAPADHPGLDGWLPGVFVAAAALAWAALRRRRGTASSRVQPGA